MSMKNKQESLTKDIAKIGSLIESADRIVIGAGAGLSASAGLDYSDEKIFSDLYPFFWKKGYTSIGDAIAHHWTLTEENAQWFWGFWAHHITNVYYRPGQLETYRYLYEIIKDKDYFIVTTNVDDQFFRGGYHKERIFSMQGSYGRFQCLHACCDKLYDNASMVKTMLEGFDTSRLTIRKEDIPRCPECGGLLGPNLRKDHYFVEGGSLDRREEYINYINKEEGKLLLIELGVGYNTPIIIKYPFEEMLKVYEQSFLVRINKYIAKPSRLDETRSLEIKGDIHDILKELLRQRGYNG